MLKGRVLLLNMDFEVLGTVGVARAIRMTMREENPIVVHEYVPDKFLTSGNGTKYPVPSVISLKHYVNVRQKRADSGAKRMKIYLRDGYQCQYCGVKPNKIHPITKKKIEVRDLTLDHITPRSRGGSGHPNNLVTACKFCNQRKADRDPDEARMPLRTKIHDITQVGVDNIMLCKYVEHCPEWFPYLEGKEGFVEAYEKYLTMVA